MQDVLMLQSVKFNFQYNKSSKIYVGHNDKCRVYLPWLGNQRRHMSLNETLWAVYVLQGWAGTSRKGFI